MTEEITKGSLLLARLIRAHTDVVKTTFYSHPSDNLQVGHIVYPALGEVVRHAHLPVERSIVGTAEVVIVQKGSCEVEIFGADREFVTKRTLNIGDVLVTLAGGHGFKMLEDTILLEVKQGPYAGTNDKERF